MSLELGCLRTWTIIPIRSSQSDVFSPTNFTIQGLKAIGFTGKFMAWIKMMYDEQKAPQRRIYMNGYYSDWFSIKSGVAQGCPISPLLFLVVAEALRNSILMEPKLKGIKIHETNYLISQFADDTTLMLGHKNEIKFANRALKRWCKATGMRENATKREGVKMGKYRYQNIVAPEVKWAEDGEFVKSLDYPSAMT